MLKIYPKLTKEYILERISQEKIMAYYIGVPVIHDNFIGNSFCNPFRDDKNPTCNYYYDKQNKLRVRDFAGDYLDRLYNFDCFDAVGHKHYINSNHKQGFKLVQHIIARDFKINKYEEENNVLEFDEFLNKQTFKKTRLKVIKVVPRAWSKVDELYWYKKYGISSSLLKYFKVIPVEALYVEAANGELYQTYWYKANNVAYAYYGGKEMDIDLWKIYFPFGKQQGKTKIISNKQFEQGLDQFVVSRIGVITKSYKDVILLRKFGICAITLASETTKPKPDTIFMLKQYCDIIISLLDFDRTGISMARFLKKEYNIPPLMLTNGKYNTINYGAKDITDYQEMFGEQKTLELIRKAIKFIEVTYLEGLYENNMQYNWIYDRDYRNSL